MATKTQRDKARELIHVGYLRDRKRDVESVEAAMKGIAP